MTQDPENFRKPTRAKAAAGVMTDGADVDIGRGDFNPIERVQPSGLIPVSLTASITVL